MHGIVVITGMVFVPGIEVVADSISWATKGKIEYNTTKQKGAASSAPTFGNVIRAFKSTSAIAVNRITDRQGVPVWQRNYYEHIIRNEPELDRIREYIVNNPLNWETDENYTH